MTADELDALLYEKFALRREDMVAALKTLPMYSAGRSGALRRGGPLAPVASGSTDDPEAYAHVAADIVAHTALLINSAYSASAAAGSARCQRVPRATTATRQNTVGNLRQRRRMFPALQFESHPQTNLPYKQIRGLEIGCSRPCLLICIPCRSLDSCAPPNQISRSTVDVCPRCSGCTAAAPLNQSCGSLRPRTGPADDSRSCHAA